MATPGFREKAFTPPEAEDFARRLLGIKSRNYEDAIETPLGNLSDYQRGQFNTLLLLHYYRMSLDARKNSELGKRIFAIVATLQEDVNKPKFREGAADSGLEAYLYATYPEFTAMQSLRATGYQEYVIAQRTTAARPTFLNYLREGRDQGVMAATPQPVEALAEIDEKQLDQMAAGLRFGGWDNGWNRGEKLRVLREDWIERVFRVTPEAADHVLKAWVEAYARIEEKNKAEAREWIIESKEMEALGQRIAGMAASRTGNPAMEVVRSFEAWRVNRALAAMSNEQKADLELSKFPERLRNTPLPKMLEAITETPTFAGLENAQERMKYIARFRELRTGDKYKKERDFMEQELVALTKWLDQRGVVVTKTRSDGARVEETDPLPRIESVGNAFNEIARSYADSDPALVELMHRARASPERALYRLYQRFLIGMDSASSRFFEGIGENDGNFVEQVGRRLERIRTIEALDGQEIWASRYRSSIATDSTRSYMEEQAYNQSAKLDLTGAAQFGRFFRAARQHMLEHDPVEDKAITATVARTMVQLQVNPLVRTKYLQTLEHLAELCHNEPKMFRQAVDLLFAKVDGSLKNLYSSQVPPSGMSFRETVEELAIVFDQVAAIGRDSVSNYSNYTLWDRTIQVDPGGFHGITHKPSPWRAGLWAPRSRVGGLDPFYFAVRFNPVLPQLTYGPGAVSTARYGGTYTTPQVRRLTIPDSVDAELDAMYRYMEPGHAAVAIPTGLPGTAITWVSGTLLLNKIQQAFIVNRPREWSGKAVGGSVGLAVAGRKEGDEWITGGAGLGSYITRTGGGMVIGASGDSQDRLVMGYGASAVPIAVWDSNRKEFNLTTATAGYEQQPEGEQKRRRLVAQAAAQVYDPNNPKEMAFVLSGEEAPDSYEIPTAGGTGKPEKVAIGRKTGTARAYYVDRKGRLVELMGGLDDLINAYNYAAARLDIKPVVMALNVEPLTRTGGGAIAADLPRRTALLAHIQSLPDPTMLGRPASEGAIGQQMIQLGQRETALRERLTDAEGRRSQAAGEELRARVQADGTRDPVKKQAALLEVEKWKAQREAADAERNDLGLQLRGIKQARDGLRQELRGLGESNIAYHDAHIDTAQKKLGTAKDRLEMAEKERAAAIAERDSAAVQEAFARGKATSARGADRDAARIEVGRWQQVRKEAERRILEAESRIRQAKGDVEAAQQQFNDALGQSPPAYWQWTLAGAKTFGKQWEGKGGDKTTVAEVRLPGEFFSRQVADGKLERTGMQELTVSILRREREGTLERRWELSSGAGVVGLQKGEDEVEYGGRAGLSFRLEKSDEAERRVRGPVFSAGGALTYEGGLTDIEGVRIAQEQANVIRGLHRIGATGYLSGMVGENTLGGVLLNVTGQLATLDTSNEVQFDNALWTFIGTLEGLQSIRQMKGKVPWAARVEISRQAGLDQMMTAYNQLQTDLGNDPRNARAYVDRFKNDYKNSVQSMLDNYYFGATIGRDFSVELNVYTREPAGTPGMGAENLDKWTGQWVENATGRMLWTHRGGRGFARAFVQIPGLYGAGVITQGGQTRMMGQAGAGFGVQLWNGAWFNRFAFDASLTLQGQDTPTAGRQWTDPGYAVQGAVRVYTNMIADTLEGKGLEETYRRYQEEVIPPDIQAGPPRINFRLFNFVHRIIIADKLVNHGFRKEMIDDIREGKLVQLDSPAMKETLRNAVWAWYNDEADKLNLKFRNDTRVYLAGSYYSALGAWDVVAMAQLAKRAELFMFFTGRPDYEQLAAVQPAAAGTAGVSGVVPAHVPTKSAVFAGARFSPVPRVVAGAVLGIDDKGEAAGAVSVTVKNVGPGELVFYGQFNTSRAPAYARPWEIAPQLNLQPEWSAGITYTIGPSGTVAPQIPGQQLPTGNPVPVEPRR